MKLYLIFTGELRCVKSKTYTTKDGKQAVSHSVGVESNDELGMLKCNKDIVDRIDRGVVSKGDVCEFRAEFDTSYGTFRVVDVMTL